MRFLKMILVFDLICIIAIFCIDKIVCAAKANDATSESNTILTEYKLSDIYSSQNEPATDTNAELTYINNNPELYGDVLVDLANKYEEAIDFVYNYPEEYSKPHDATLNEAIDFSSVPMLYQWDKRWGYMDYSGGLMGYTGCGPTSLSMVLLYLTHDTTLTPAKVAEYAIENGYSCEGSGSYWTLMSDGCEHFGVHSKEVPLNEGSMIEALRNDQPLICIMGPGDFTDSGHFIVITDYVDGKFKVNDCFSPSRSEKLWSYYEIANQIKNIWRFYVSE